MVEVIHVKPESREIVSTAISQATADRLDAYCVKQGITKSQALRDFVAACLNVVEPEPKRLVKKRRTRIQRHAASRA